MTELTAHKVAAALAQIVLAAFAALSAEHDVLVCFRPPQGKGVCAVEHYHVSADGVWRKTATIDLDGEVPSGLAQVGDGWVYADGGRSIARFRVDGQGGLRRFCEADCSLHTLVASPDRRWLYCVNFRFGEGAYGTLQRYQLSDPECEGAVMDGLTDGAHVLEGARQMAFDRSGLLYVGCRGNRLDSKRCGVAVLDVSGPKPREVAFYAAGRSSAGFAFDPQMRFLSVHGFGTGKDRIFRLGEPGQSVEIESGFVNSFAAVCLDGEWHCGDYADGTVRKFTSAGTYETVAKLRCGLTAMVLLDGVGRSASERSGCDGVRRSFSPLYGNFRRVPYNSAGTCDLKVGLWGFPMPMDFNDDGVNDLVVQCPDTPNCGTFFFAGRPDGVFLPPVRIDSRERWNIASSVVDGRAVVADRDTTYWNFTERNGFRRDESCRDNPFHPSRSSLWRYADLDGDGLVDRIRFQRGCGFWDRCTGGFAQEARYAPSEVFVRGTAIMSDVGDLDGDGLPDVLTTRRTDGFAWCRNSGTRQGCRFDPPKELVDSAGGRLHMPLCMITPTIFDWDGDGRMDIICGDEDGRVALIRNAGRKTAEGIPVFDPPKMFRQLRRDLAFGVLNTPSAVDWDGDGDIDLLTGDSAGHIAFVENLSGPGVEYPSWNEPRLLSCAGAGGIPADCSSNDPIRIMAGPTGSIQGPGEEKWGYTAVSAADWDGDGLPDVVVNSVWGYVYWHRNVGTRQKPRLGPATPIEAEWKDGQPELKWGVNRSKGKEIMTQWRTTPLALDWDGDGLTDLIMVDTEGYLCLWQRRRQDGRLLLDPPQRVLLDERTGHALRPNAGRAGKSGRRKLTACDWDGDGRTDLFVNTGDLCHGNTEYWRQVDCRDGHWTFRHEGRLSSSVLEGHASSPCAVDFNADGIPDMLSGCEDGFFYYLRNPRSRLEAKRERSER